MASYVWINESLCELALGSEIIMEPHENLTTLIKLYRKALKSLNLAYTISGQGANFAKIWLSFHLTGCVKPLSFFLLRTGSMNSGNYSALAEHEKILEFQLSLRTSISLILLVVVCSCNDLVTDELPSHWTNENENWVLVFSQKEN